MKLGLQLGYDDPKGGVALAQEADRLGFHSAWTSEAWGADAVTGGTGKYAGVRGEVRVQTRENKVITTFHFVD